MKRFTANPLAGLLGKVLFVFALLFVIQCYCGKNQPKATRIADEERAGLIMIAQTELKRMNIPPRNRRVTVTTDGNDATVTYHVPKNMLGGDFVINIDRATKTVISRQIGR